MRRTLPMTLWLLLLGGACSDDQEQGLVVSSGVLGSKCTCDSDCAPYGNWATTCFKGICMVQPEGDCGGAGVCPEGTVCVNLAHGDNTFPVCALACEGELACHGQCDADGACVPGPGDNCLMGCCTAADPPFGSMEDPYPDEEWDAPTCGLGPGADYPCPPYGKRSGRTIPNLAFMAANDEAVAVAGPDGVLSFSDVFHARPKLIIVFGSAKW